MKTLTEKAVRDKIRAYIDTHHGGNQAEAARAWGYSRPYLWRVLNGHKRPLFGFGWWTLALPAAGAVMLVVIARELDR